jgi:hypothetical protein
VYAYRQFLIAAVNSPSVCNRIDLQFCGLQPQKRRQTAGCSQAGIAMGGKAMLEKSERIPV